MNAKTLLTIGLLVFVAAGVGVAVYKQAGSGPQAGPISPEGGATAGQTPGSSDPASNAGPAETAQGKRVIAYYFHGNARCPTCVNMEHYAHEAVDTGFWGLDTLHSWDQPAFACRPTESTARGGI